MMGFKRNEWKSMIAQQRKEQLLQSWLQLMVDPIRASSMSLRKHIQPPINLTHISYSGIYIPQVWVAFKGVVAFLVFFGES